jgi:glycosyltransferase involved in cell wall biosynthesis
MTVGIPIGQEFMGERRYPRERRYVLCGAIFNYDWMAQPIIECIRELAPYLRANHSDVEIVCLGKRPTSATLKAIGAMAGVRHIEWVPDYRRMVQDAFLYIYPNRCVSGIQTKIQQAMASGVPVVSTAEVLEAIGAVDGEHAIQCDSAEDICRKVEPLLQDRELWERISSNGRQLILHKYGEEAVMLQLKRAYATALGGSCSESGQDDAELA